MPQTPSNPTTNRIAKVIARAGLCSRRQAEQWVVDGRVKVNGKLIRTAAFNVTDDDKVEVDGNLLAARAGTRVWLYHKPSGLVVTENDPEGRRTIFDELEKNGLPRVMTVGRLDINTEGLLLLTNDGGLKRVLELPATGWLRRYRVRAHGRVTQEQLDGLAKGIEIEGVKYGPIEAGLERVKGGNVWITLALREGKNREVKNVLGALGLVVNRLIRTSYGPFQLGDIPTGAVTVVRARVLRDQLGKKLAEEAGVDFDSPLPDGVEPVVLAQNPNTRLRKKTDTGLERAPRPHGRTGEPKPAGEKKARKNAPERRGNFAPFQRKPREEKLVEKRIAHFTDGREPVEFEPKAKRRGSDDDDKGFRRGGKDGGGKVGGGEERPARGRPDGPRPHRANGDGPRQKRTGEDRSSSARPPRGRSDGPPKGGKFSGGGKPGGGKSFGGKPSGGKPSGGRPSGPSRGGAPRGGAGRSSAPRGRGPK